MDTVEILEKDLIKKILVYTLLMKKSVYRLTAGSRFSIRGQRDYFKKLKAIWNINLSAEATER